MQAQRTIEEPLANPLTSVEFSATLDGTILTVESKGSVPAELKLFFYRYGTIPRYGNQLLPVKPDSPTVFNVVLQTGEKKTLQLPQGRYDVLVLLNDQPIGATSIEVNELNGTLGKALALLGLAITLLIRG